MANWSDNASYEPIHKLSWNGVAHESRRRSQHYRADFARLQSVEQAVAQDYEAVGSASHVLKSLEHLRGLRRDVESPEPELHLYSDVEIGDTDQLLLPLNQECWGVGNWF